MNEKKAGYELAVQRNINRIFEFISCNFAELPKTEATRIQINNQIRLQKMLSYIYENYAETVTLEDIAKAADISRSEAGRCFRTFMGCSPVEALIHYRLQVAHRLLSEKTQTLQQISYACGFNSTNYFSRQFKKRYGYAPSQTDSVGK
jgi:transcriptional regulator GlxA family with amidase domain